MESTPVERSAPIHYHVVPGSSDGWDVVVERENRIVASTHCSDWYRVERICAELERQQSDRLHAGARTAH